MDLVTNESRRTPLQRTSPISGRSRSTPSIHESRRSTPSRPFAPRTPSRIGALSRYVRSAPISFDFDREDPRPSTYRPHAASTATQTASTTISLDLEEIASSADSRSSPSREPRKRPSVDYDSTLHAVSIFQTFNGKPQRSPRPKQNTLQTLLLLLLFSSASEIKRTNEGKERDGGGGGG